MLNDTLEGMDDEDLEDVANTEVDKILAEVLEGHGPLPVAPEPVRNAMLNPWLQTLVSNRTVSMVQLSYADCIG